MIAHPEGNRNICAKFHGNPTKTWLTDKVIGSIVNVLISAALRCDWPLTICPQITGVPQESLVTVVKPGLPTTADLYVLPLDSKPAKRSMFVDKVHACMENHIQYPHSGLWTDTNSQVSWFSSQFLKHFSTSANSSGLKQVTVPGIELKFAFSVSSLLLD